MREEDKIIELLNTQRDAALAFNSRGDDKVQFHADFKDGKLYEAYAYIYRQLKDCEGKFVKNEFFERVGSSIDIDRAIEIAQAFFDNRVAYSEEMMQRTIVGFHIMEENSDGQA